MALTPEQQAEVDELRLGQHQTRRATVPELEEVLYKAIPVLDHGFVRVIDYMGNDAAIVQAARVSYGRGTKHTRGDAGLINYLMRNSHTSPFEMCEIKLHVKLPIFVARQWVRHRTASINEYSARYSVLDSEFYIPDPGHLAVQSAANQQGRKEHAPDSQLELLNAPSPPSEESDRGAVLTIAEAERIRELFRENGENAFKLYAFLLNVDEDGEQKDTARKPLARELARINLPLSAYTQWYWKVNLHNLLHFLQLRADSHAQWEIRAYAIKLLEIVEKWVPLTYKAYSTFRTGGIHLTANGLDVVKRLIAGEDVDPKSAGMSPGELRELMAHLIVDEPPAPKKGSSGRPKRSQKTAPEQMKTDFDMSEPISSPKVPSS